ncbi:hypothetical protein E2C01_028786 [Portunus trituberculatus]|uniref:Uncharacterized protein n=1 Tax=Portunus trituberculatus TaxID=210409 RepID=A0A5B7ESR7_PORTR|nr:hypothetical protein [Portunus trituberculatus]
MNAEQYLHTIKRETDQDKRGSSKTHKGELQSCTTTLSLRTIGGSLLARAIKLKTREPAITHLRVACASYADEEMSSMELFLFLTPQKIRQRGAQNYPSIFICH